MARIIEAKAVISAEDKTGKAFDSINRKFKEMDKGAKLATGFSKLGKEIDAATRGLREMERFRGVQTSFAQARTSFRTTQAEVSRLAGALGEARKAAAEFDGIRAFGKNSAIAKEMADARRRVTELERDLNGAQRAVKAASTAFDTQAAALKAVKGELRASGIPLERLGETEASLRGRLSAATDEIERQGRAAEKSAVQAGHLTRANRDLVRGMGDAGRRQADVILTNRRLIDGMGQAGRQGRLQPEHAGLVVPPPAPRRPGRPERRERTLGPLAGAVGAYEVINSYKEAAAFDRRLTLIGQTADASRAEIDRLGGSIHDLAQQTATPIDKLAGGLEALVAQGRNLKDSMNFLPSVARTAAASGSEVDDIAKTADSVGSNFGISGRDMQKAFDIMAAGGKAGQFELKDMARYLPSLGPASSAVGFKGEKGLSELVAMLQVMRKGSGTSEEAVSSMNNILAKMESDKTLKALREAGVKPEEAFAKARKEGKNLVAVFEELITKATKGDVSKIGEFIDDMEFKRGVLALMTFKGEWQKLSQALRDTSGGTVMRDLVQVTKDAQAGVDRLGNSWKRFTQAAARAGDAGGISSGLGKLGKELEEVAQTMERLNQAYDEGGLSKLFGQGSEDARDRFKENRKLWLDHYGTKEDKRIAELEAARDAHRKKLQGEGRSEAEIASAMRVRDRDIERAKARKAAVTKAREAPALADQKPLRMGVDPTAPLQGPTEAIGQGQGSNLGRAFNEAFPVDLNPRRPLPAITPLPPRRPDSLPRTIERVDDVLGPGGVQGPGTFTPERWRHAPLPPVRPSEFRSGTIPVEVVSLPKGAPAADPAAKTMPGGTGPAGAFPFREEISRGKLGDLFFGPEVRTHALPGFGQGDKALPDRASDPSGQLAAIANTLDRVTLASAARAGVGPSPETGAKGDSRLEATVKPDQILARVDQLPPVSGEARVTVDNNHQITITVDAEWVKATARAEAKQIVASMPLGSSGARPGAATMPGAAAPPAGR